MELAYATAKANFIKGGVNRVIMATDGDFNVGITDPEQLQDLVERKRETGIYLSVLGFGAGNYNDALMQRLAQNGNGVAAYIDSEAEAQRVLGEQANGATPPVPTGPPRYRAAGLRRPRRGGRPMIQPLTFAPCIGVPCPR